MLLPVVDLVRILFRCQESLSTFSFSHFPERMYVYTYMSAIFFPIRSPLYRCCCCSSNSDIPIRSSAHYSSRHYSHIVVLFPSQSLHSKVASSSLLGLSQVNELHDLCNNCNDCDNYNDDNSNRNITCNIDNNTDNNNNNSLNKRISTVSTVPTQISTALTNINSLNSPNPNINSS